MNCPREDSLTQEIEHGQTIDLLQLHIVDPEHAPAHARDTETIDKETVDLKTEEDHPNTGYL